MQNVDTSSQAKQMLLIWWILWTSILAGLALLYVFFGRGPVKPSPSGDIFVNLAGLVPLFMSIVIRWLVLPRYTELARAFIMFIVGLALAEVCGILGIFLGGPYRDDLFLLGALGIAQYAPFFARRYLEPKPEGFIPNN